MLPVMVESVFENTRTEKSTNIKPIRKNIINTRCMCTGIGGREGVGVGLLLDIF